MPRPARSQLGALTPLFAATFAAPMGCMIFDSGLNWRRLGGGRLFVANPDFSGKKSILTRVSKRVFWLEQNEES